MNSSPAFCFLFIFLVIEWKCQDAEGKLFSLDLSESRTHVTRGTDVSIECRVRTDSPPSITWLQDEVDVSQIENWPGTIGPTQIRHPRKEEGHPLYESELRITPNANHSYSCSASNSHGTVKMDTKIYVGEKASITKLVKDPLRPQAKGHNVSVLCSVRSVPKPEFVWHYIDDFDSNPDGEEIEVEIDAQFDVQMVREEFEWVSVLHLLPVSSDANYSCTASNPYGRDKKRIEVTTVDRAIGQECSVDLDCSFSVADSACAEGNCTCPSTHSVHVLGLKKCLPAVPFKGRCEHSGQCSALDPNTFCTVHNRQTCQCKDGYIYSMDNLQCVEMRAEQEYLTVLLAIGSTLAFIVTLTLLLYFKRKRTEKKQLTKLRAANARLNNNSIPANLTIHDESPNGSANGKTVHFTT